MMRAITRSILNDLGLHFSHSFLFDRQFHYALLAAPVLLGALSSINPDWAHGIAISLALVVSIVLWRPLIEELLFRGFLQGELNRRFQS
ncbi:type II CAAX prenyl endopeptidase Rce1 family protein [Noviherbaspirillum saxi]|uniref:CPBP family intramembrane metalloprotease n=1 Tax=Noviherbaspirillum saxi TaxID=2320863 RepID=A0A3A3FTC2_9BURK|nr:CPBP family glutamic-type intramembrane protease [Noviherbaspirillum saxi]RJF98770.1 CPBP family intramembrane metalloprotease [Noviherbaspirillum saxi]